MQPEGFAGTVLANSNGFPKTVDRSTFARVRRHPPAFGSVQLNALCQSTIF
jgi:hypothetical protein